MKKTEVLFFFDTEDFTSETNADATLHLANILTEEGVTGHFGIVGLVAEQFANWGRNDVVEALRPHIIGSHTYGHTLHPDIVEMSEGEDFDAAYQRVMEKEAAAVEMIKKYLDTNEIFFAAPPGDSKSYVAMYCYHELGIPFYCDTVVHDARNTLVEYAGIKQISYTDSLENMYLYGEPREDRDILNSLTPYDRVIIYTHPNITVKKEFWDSLNYAHENLREYGDWIGAEDRSPEEIQFLRNRFRGLIRAFKADERFEITDLHKINDQLGKKPVRKILPADLPEIYAELESYLYPPKNGRYSIAEVFHACVEFLRGNTEFFPEDRLTHGFLATPIGITASVTVSKNDILEALPAINLCDFLPTEIHVGNSLIGPADFLFAMLEILTTDHETVTLMPRKQCVMMPEFEELCSFRMDGDSWMHSYDFLDEYVSDRLRLQSWTLRYCGI